jgi:hypothetical protein
MNPANQKNVCANNSVTSDQPNSYEQTLRLLATIPVPQGLADRVQAGLRSALRQSRVLAWPAALKPDSNWMRAAAAAAIVAVVGGGGWGVYSRVQPASPSRAIVMPSHLAAPGGFSNAGAMRTPQTLNGPQVAQPATVATPQPAKLAVKTPELKSPSTRHDKPGTVNKATSESTADRAADRAK